MIKGRTYFVSLILITIMLLSICTQAYAENHIHTWMVDFCIDCGERREVFQHGMWKYVFLPITSEIEIVGHTDGETDASIPEQIDGIPVTSIGGTAFWGCDSLTSITIPGSVTSIAGNPFRWSTVQIKVSPTHPTFTVLNGALVEKPTKRLVAYPYWADATSWDIPQGIVEIGDYAFDGCEILTNINIPDSVTSVGNYAFHDCGLLSITIPDSVKSIGDRAFYFCRHLTDIVIPDGVTSIGDDAFSYCDRLTTITIPDSVTSIGINPFHDSNIKIQISSEHPAYTLIDGALFDKANKQLISYSSNADAVLYDIPQGTLGIGDKAFVRSRNLTSISIPDSVTFIGNYAFDRCSSLTSITIPNGVTSIGDFTFFGCKNLTSITIPDGVTSIGVRAFSDCESLTSITIPDSVTTIGKVAFAECDELKSVVLPDSVTFIGVNAFDSCRKLTATVTKNSYSEQYCIKNDIYYIYPDTYDWLKS